MHVVTIRKFALQTGLFLREHARSGLVFEIMKIQINDELGFFLSSYRSLTKLVPLEAVFFDIDGTLCDSDPLHHIAYQDVLAEVQNYNIEKAFCLFYEC